jgi:HlyD family secretion protein
VELSSGSGQSPKQIVPAWRRSSRLFLWLLVGSVILAGVAGFVGSRFSSPRQQAADAEAPPYTDITEAIKYGVLQATVVTRGSVADVDPLSFGVPNDLGNDQAVITNLMATQGAELQNGECLMAVAERPITVLAGEIPAFRDMDPGDSGIDISQLQTNLREMGFGTGADALGTYGFGTEQAVRAWYAKLGFQPALYPSNADSQIQTLQAAVAAAQSTLDQDGNTLAAATGVPVQPGGGSGASIATLEQSVVSDRSALASAQAALTSGDATMGASVPLGEVIFVPTLPESLISLNVALGGTAPAKGPIGVIGSGKVDISATADASEISSIHVGESATGHSDISSETFDAKVSNIATKPQNDSSTGTEMYGVTLTPTALVPTDLIGQNVEVTIDTGSSRAKTWIVPLGAVSTDVSGNSYIAVQKGKLRISVSVDTGLIAGELEAVNPLKARLNKRDRVIIGVQASRS